MFELLSRGVVSNNPLMICRKRDARPNIVERIVMTGRNNARGARSSTERGVAARQLRADREVTDLQYRAARERSQGTQRAGLELYPDIPRHRSPGRRR